MEPAMIRAYNTCREMMRLRGYEKVETTDSTTLNAKTVSGGNVECKFFLEPKLNINILKLYLQEKNCQDFETIIIVGKQILPCNSSKTTRANENVEIFTVDELQINVMEHEYQPEFKQMDDPKFLDSFHKTGWPVMLATDSVARFMRYKKGSVIRITRNGLTSYRIVL
jgi:DNA-directed RNA polymerase subunit H (RpoH/RPB5)